MDEAIRWLHVSDLHVGCSGEALWEQVQRDFLRSLKEEVRTLGGLDLVLVTGDLANRGTAAEYEQVDRFLERVVAAAGDPAAVLAVPGNHDVQRPATAKDARLYDWLRYYREPTQRALRDHLWKNHDRTLVAPLFADYEPWWRAWSARVSPAVEVHHSDAMPGDFSATLRKGAFTLGIIGLNSAFAHFSGADHRKSIQLEREQLHAALPDDPSDKLGFFDRCDRALLLMHHPIDWLHPAAVDDLNDGIFRSGRFTSLLHGHMHELESASWGPTRRRLRDRLQAPSLFGVEHYADAARESRLHGYVIGEVRKDGRLRIRPWEGQKGRDGAWRFVPDSRLDDADEEGWVVMRDGDPEAPPPVHEAPLAVADAESLSEYLSWARARHARISMIGVGADQLHFHLDDVYVALRAQRTVPLLDGKRGARGRRKGDDLHDMGARAVPFEDVFREADVGQGVVVLGQAGGGKTTALRKMAHEVLEGRAADLGLVRGTLPILVRARTIAAHLGATLETVIQAELDEQTGGELSGVGAALASRRGVLLLVDGLDEVATAKLRARVCRWVEKRLPVLHARGGRCAVSSRYDGYDGEARLSGAFSRFDLQPLDRAGIVDLVNRWFQAACQKDLGPDRSQTAEQRAVALARKITDRVDLLDLRLAAMVSTPLLLTLLCLVVLSGFDIPDKRVEFFRRCLDILLKQWPKCRGGERDEQLEPPPLDVPGAQLLLRTAAWELQRRGRKDDLTLAELSAFWREPLDRLRRGNRTTADAARLLDWLTRDAAVLAEYGEDRYGFSHLQLQEFLVAQHLTQAGGELLGELAGRFDDPKWEETILLAVGLPEAGAFVPLMRRVLATGALLTRRELIGQCIAETDDPDPLPFVERLSDPSETADRRDAIVTLLGARGGEAVAEIARTWLEQGDPTLRATARRVLGLRSEDSRGTERAAIEPAAATAPALVARGGGRLEPGKPHVCDVSGIRYLWVPRGVFWMGARDISNVEKPHHRVRVSPFWLAETPVTNAQYERFLRASPTARKPEFWGDRRFSQSDQPVVGVSWHDLRSYCAWLAETSSLPAILPSEAQWEWAARGDEVRRYPWGNDPKPNVRLACFGNLGAEPKRVGQYPKGAGPFGHLDLAGNVWEWCLDVWDDKAYESEAHRNGPLDPIVVKGDVGRRALRGGSFWDDAGSLRSSFRHRELAGSRASHIGFRVALSPASRWPS